MKELALLYYPNHQDGRYAAQCLRKMIKDYPELLQELTEANWQSSNVIVTPRQEDIILRFLGTPKKH